MLILGDKMTKEPLFTAVVPLEILKKFSKNLDQVIKKFKELEEKEINRGRKR